MDQEETPARKCQCKHRSHFDLNKVSTCHNYGVPARELQPVKTEFGTFHVCQTCADTCWRNLTMPYLPGYDADVDDPDYTIRFQSAADRAPASFQPLINYLWSNGPSDNDWRRRFVSLVREFASQHKQLHVASYEAEDPYHRMGR
jgi:hypothetical protein